MDSNDIDKDWYTYLSEDFKLDRKCYKTADYVVVDCPKCQKSRVLRVNDLKMKIKRLGFFECSRCRKSQSLVIARQSFKDKYGVNNPYSLSEIIDKIKKKKGAKKLP